MPVTVVVSVATVGKIKTVVQMVAVTCLLYSITPEGGRVEHPEPWLAGLVFHVGDWLLAAAALLTLWSGYEYLRAAWPSLREKGGAGS